MESFFIFTTIDILKLLYSENDFVFVCRVTIRHL